jgi:hypothetical protein
MLFSGGMYPLNEDEGPFVPATEDVDVDRLVWRRCECEGSFKCSAPLKRRRNRMVSKSKVRVSRSPRHGHPNSET